MRDSGPDIVALLRQDHDLIRSMLTRVASGTVEDRWATFLALTDLVIRHEVAEELVVYPALLRLRGGVAVAESRLSDQAGIERLLVTLDREEFDTHQFEMDSVRLGLDVLAHLEKEDAQVMPLLATKLGNRRRKDLARRFTEVKRVAPPRLPTGLRAPTGPAIVDRTTAVSVWMRDSAAYSGLAS